MSWYLKFKCLLKHILEKTKTKQTKNTEAEPKTITIAIIVVESGSNNSHCFSLKDSKFWSEVYKFEISFPRN